MADIANLLLTITGDSAGAMAAIGEVDAGVKKLGETSVKSNSALADIGGALLKFGEVAAGVGAVVGAVSIKMASDLQRQMTLVRTQAHDTTDNMQQMTNQVIDMSTQVGISADKLAEGLYHVASVGYRGADAMDILKIAAEGARVGNADLDATTYALTSTMNTFGLGAKDAQSTMATLNAIVGAGDMRFQDLNGAISTGFLAAGETFGVSIQSMGAALAYMTDRGASAEESATRLKMSINLLGAPTSHSSKILQDLGLSADEAKQRTSAMEEALKKAGVTTTQLSADLRKPDGIQVALQDLVDHMHKGGLSADEMAAVLSRAFGGGRSGAAIMSMVQHLDTLQSKFDMVNKGAARFGQDWEDTQKTFNFQLDRLRTNVEALALRLGNTLLPVATAVVKYFADNIGVVSRWGDEIARLAHAVGTDLTTAFTTLSDLFGRVASGGSGASALFGLFTGIRPSGPSGPQESGHTTMRMNAAPSGEQLDYQEGGAAFRRGLSGPTELPGLQGRAPTPADYTQEGGRNPMIGFARKEILPSAAQRAVGSNLGLARGVGAGEAPAAPPPAYQPADLSGPAQLANTLGPILDHVVEVMTRFNAAWKELRSDLAAGASPIATLVGVLMRLGVSGDQAVGIAHALDGAWRGLQQVWQIVAATLGPSLRDLLDKGIRPALAEIGRNLGPLGRQFGDAFREWAPILREVAIVLGAVLLIALRLLIQILTVVLPPAVHIVMDLFQILALVLKVVADIIRGDWRSLGTDLLNIARLIFDGMFATWRMMNDAIQLVARQIVEAVVRFFQWLWDQLIGHSIIPDLVNGVVGWFRNMTTWVFDIVANWADSILKKFDDLKTGIIDAAKGIATGLIDHIAQGVNGALGLFRGFLDALSKIPFVGQLVDTKALADIDVGGIKKAIGLATGGMITNGPYVIGEGDPSHPEYVIPTDPKYRGRAKGLLGQLVQAIGLAEGGIAGNPYPAGQCTAYVYSRFPGIPLNGNAGDWASLPLQHVGTPAAGEIVVYRAGDHYSQYGHVAVVESGDQGGKFLVSEMNFQGEGVVDQRFSDYTDVSTFLVPGVPGKPGAVGSLIGGVANIFGPMVDAALGTAMKAVGGLPPWIQGLVKGVLGKIAGGVKSKFANIVGGASGAQVAGAHPEWLHAAEAIAGVGADWDTGLSIIIGHESSWNPAAANLSDSNAAAGNASVGLMQLTGTNRARYDPDESPVGQIVGGIRYILDRYGSIGNVPGVRSVLSGGPYLPYDSGGLLPPGLTMAWNGTGRNEVVSPPGAGGLGDIGVKLDKTNALLHAILHDQLGPSGDFAGALRTGAA